MVVGARPDAPIVPAVEIMICNPTVRKLIHEGGDDSIPSAIRAGKEEKMQDFNTSLLNLINTGMVTEEVAIRNSPNPEGLKMNIKGIFLSEDSGLV